MKDTIIRCKSKEEYKAVLKKLEKKGCTWFSGHKPTEEMGYYDHGCDLLLVYNDRIATFPSDPVLFDKNDYKNYEDITADDFIGNKPIVIYRVGRTVVALNQNTDETGVAKCHPTDTFDFSVGAKLAFERLLSHSDTEVGKEKPEEQKKTAKFKVGDVVTVNLDTFVGRQYGWLTLLKDMAEYGKPLKIEEVHKTSEGVFYTCSNRFSYNEQMLKHYDDEITIGCTVEVTDAGKSYTTYAKWVDDNIVDPSDKLRYKYGVAPKKGFIGTVIKIDPHKKYADRTLVYFKCCDDCYLINADGVRKYNE